MPGDQLLSINDISMILDDIEVDNDVVIEVLRDGEVITVNTKVGEKSDFADQLQISIDNGLMKMYIDGDEKKIFDFENMMQKIQQGLGEEGSKLDAKLDSLQKKLKHLDVDVLRIEDRGAI